MSFLFSPKFHPSWVKWAFFFISFYCKDTRILQGFLQYRVLWVRILSSSHWHTVHTGFFPAGDPCSAGQVTGGCSKQPSMSKCPRGQRADLVSLKSPDESNCTCTHIIFSLLTQVTLKATCWRPCSLLWDAEIPYHQILRDYSLVSYFSVE